jgi:hypothetical protein
MKTHTNKTMDAVKGRLVELEAQLDERLFGVRRGPNGELIEDEGSGITAGKVIKVGAIGAGAGVAGGAAAPYVNRFRQSVQAGAPMKSAALAGVRSAGADARAAAGRMGGALKAAPGGLVGEAGFRFRKAGVAGRAALKGANGKSGVLGRVARAVKAAAGAMV